MKMKIFRAGADRGGDKQNQLVLLGSVEDIRSLRHMVGMELEVEIRPDLRFSIGDKVHYSSVIGGAPTLRDTEVTDGPFVVGNSLCWKIRGHVGVVAQDALTGAA